MEVGRLIILVSALVGLYISSYFTLVTYGLLPATSRFVPTFCRMEEGACSTLVHTRSARLFLGIPNSLLGTLYYALLILFVATTAFELRAALLSLALIAILTVCVGVYLTHQLLAVLRIACPLCLASHVLNLVIALSLWGSLIL